MAGQALDTKRLQLELQKFAQDRDWNQFHSPKNLSMALSVEAAELMEHFQWLTEEQSKKPDGIKLQAITSEIADVQVYLLMLADKLSINIETAVEVKMEENRHKYPADRVKGSAAKYTEYE